MAKQLRNAECVPKLIVADDTASAPQRFGANEHECGTVIMKGKGGRPKLEHPKVHIGFRLAADVVEKLKASGKGYNTRVERALREALDSGRF